MVLPLHVAFIDDGINNINLMFPLKNNLEIDKCTNKFIYRTENIDELNHATKCAAIFYKYVEVTVEISSLKILHNWKGNIQHLLLALDWCASNQVDIVNISLGSTSFYDKKKFIAYFRNKKINFIMVCANSNEGILTFPACFENIIGVESHRFGRDKNLYYKNFSLNGINILAPGKHHIVFYPNISFDTEDANSYAAPYVTSFICNKYSDIKKDKINQYLFIESKQLKKIMFMGYIKFENLNDITIITNQRVPNDALAVNIKNIYTHGENFSDHLKLNTSSIVVFYWNESISLLLKKKYLDYYSRYCSNIILLDTDEEWKYIHNLKNKICWPAYLNFYNIKPTENYLDTPIILIADDSEENLLRMLDYMKKSFSSYGYNALILSNMLLGVLEDYFFHNCTSNNLMNVLINIVTIYKPDLIILGYYSVNQCQDKDIIRYFYSLGIKLDIACYNFHHFGVKKNKHIKIPSIDLSNCTEEKIFEKCYSLLIGE